MDRDSNIERWVEDRLARLEPPAEWQPDAGRAFARLPEAGRRMRNRRARRLMVVGAFAAACIGALLIEAPKAYCAGGTCASPPSKPAPVSPKSPAIMPVTPAFKISGAPGAPLTCEIYTDYQCPACAAAFRDIIPVLRAEYVATGKVRLIHRDFPLRMHAYSRLAARYANAAGWTGEYDVAVAQLFRAQSSWGKTGDIDTQLAGVLPPGEMQQVRRLVNGDAAIDSSIDADMAMGREDQITSTPTIVIVKNGRREKISPLPSYELLKNYLDGLLK